MTSKQKVLKLAEELGAEVESGGEGSSFEITVDAPDGFHWKGDGLHQLVESIWDNEKPESLWRDALERMQDGLEPCDYSEINCADTAGKGHPDLAA